MEGMKTNEVKNLCELEMSILIYGEIKPDEEGYFVSEGDKSRTQKLHELMDKYNYGWYIAQQTFAEQINSINDFKKYILSM